VRTKQKAKTKCHAAGTLNNDFNNAYDSLFCADRTLAWLATIRVQQQSVGGEREREDEEEEEEEEDEEKEEEEEEEEEEEGEDEEKKEKEEQRGEWNNERQFFAGPGGRNIRDIRDGGRNIDPGFGAGAPQEGLEDGGRVWQMGRRDFPLAVKNGNTTPLYGNVSYVIL
jgi:hypothetical protein